MENAPTPKSVTHRQRSWNFLKLTGALSMFLLATALVAAPALGAKAISRGDNYGRAMHNDQAVAKDEATLFNDALAPGLSSEEILEVVADQQALHKRGRAHPRKSIGGDLDWIRQRLGTKSPYPHEDRPEGPLDDAPDGYELVQLHLVNRHGTRYPSAKDSVAFKKLAQKLKNNTVPGYEWLQDWPSETLYPAEKGNLLSTRGDADLYAIGGRFATRYGSFLDHYPYDANTYEFRSSAKSRCSQSAYAFTLGFFEGRLASDSQMTLSSHSKKNKRELEAPPAQPIDIYTIPLGLDQEMAIQYSCPMWQTKVKDQPAVMEQQRLYQSSFMPDLAQDLSTAFAVNITEKDVARIYQICGFETSMYDNTSTWCQMLLPGLGGSAGGNSVENKSSKEGHGHGHKHDDQEGDENFLKLEIAADLDDFYNHGPGVPFNSEVGCQLGTSLVQSIDLALSKDPATGGDVSLKKKKGDDPDGEAVKAFRGHLKFGHSETIMFFSSFLGLYEQSGILTGNMTADQYAARAFRSSLFSPFAANMAFEVYQSKQDSVSSIQRHHMDRRARRDTPPAATGAQGLVRMLVNEEPVQIPGCTDSSLFCDWSLLKSVLIQRGAGCDFESCCGSTGSSTAKVIKSEIVFFAANSTCPSTAPIVA